MNVDKLFKDVCNLGEDIHPNSRFLIEKHFEERFGDNADVFMDLWNIGRIMLYGDYFLLAKVINKDVVSFNLCKDNYSNVGYEMLTNVGIQDYAQLVHILRNYETHI